MTIQTLIANFLGFINSVFVPFLFSVAFLIFIWNAARFVILRGGSEEGRARAKQLMLWGLIGFVILVSIWGIVNMFVGGLFGTDALLTPCPDAIKGQHYGGDLQDCIQINF